MFQRVYLKSSLLIVLVLGMACQKKASHLPYYNTPDFTPLFLNKEEAEQQVKHKIADFALTDQNGKVISEENVEGKIHVADFFFTTCGSICPQMTINLKTIQDAFANDSNVVLLSYSVTPWKDDTLQLNRYAKKNGVGKQWHLLTGLQGEIYQLARQSYFAEEEIGYTKDSSEFLHTEHVLLVDENKRIRGIYNGTLPLEMEQLKKDIQLLKKEE